VIGSSRKSTKKISRLKTTGSGRTALFLGFLRFRCPDEMNETGNDPKPELLVEIHGDQ
jgi:hypothetical protein